MQSYIFILDYWLEKCVAIVVFVFFGGSRAILRCLSSCSPLLERMLPQSRWGWFPKPLGMVPKAVGDGSQSYWGWFPKPLGMVPKAVGEGSQSHWGWFPKPLGMVPKAIGEVLSQASRTIASTWRGGLLYYRNAVE